MFKAALWIVWSLLALGCKSEARHPANAPTVVTAQVDEPDSGQLAVLPSDDQVPFTHAGRVNDIAYTPDGRYLVTSSGDTKIRVFDAKTGALVRGMRAARWSAYAVAVSPDGKRVLSGGRSRLYAWDLATGKLVVKAKGDMWDYLYDLDFSQDGTELITASGTMGPYRDQRVQRFDADDGDHERDYSSRPERKIGEGKNDDRAAAVGVATTAEQVAVLFSDGSLRIFPDEGGLPKIVHPHYSTATYTADLIAWRGGLISTGRDPALAYTPLDTQEPVSIIEKGTGYSVAMSPDGKLVAAGVHSEVVLLQSGTWKELARFRAPCDRDLNALAFSPDGKTLAFADDQRVGLLGLPGLEPIGPRHPGPDKPIKALEWSADGALVVAAAGDRISAWPTDGGAPKWTAKFQRKVRGLAVIDDNMMIISDYGRSRLTMASKLLQREVTEAYSDKRWVRIARPGKGRQFVALAPHSGPIHIEPQLDDKIQWAKFAPDKDGDRYPYLSCLSVADDGSAVLAGFRDALYVWRVADRKRVRIDHERVRACGLSPDGRQVAVAAGYGRDNHIALLPAKGGKGRTLLKPAYPVAEIAFTPDGQALVVAMDRQAGYRWQEDKSLFGVYDLKTGKPRWTKTTDGSVHTFAFSPDGKRIALGGDDLRIWIHEL